MIDLDKAVIARLDSHGQHFELLVDPENAVKVKKGKEISLDELLAYEEVYEDANKGNKVSKKDLERVFGTENIKKVAYKIIRKGEVQLTTKQRKRMRKQKRNKIASIISKRAINPQNNTSHPQKRILNAMDEAGIHIDESKSVSSQLNGVIDSLKPIIPISIETKKIAVKFPPKYAGKASSKIRGVGKIKREDWLNNGSWSCVIELPAGQQNNLYDKINNISKGEAETKLLED